MVPIQSAVIQVDHPLLSGAIYHISIRQLIIVRDISSIPLAFLPGFSCVGFYPGIYKYNILKNNIYTARIKPRLDQMILADFLFFL
jgi:hypothetical protein